MLLMYADIISQGPECAEYSTVHSVANKIEMSSLGNESNDYMRVVHPNLIRPKNVLKVQYLHVLSCVSSFGIH